MLELTSTAWGAIKASPGGDGRLTAQLLAQLYAGDASAWEELYQQVCHQYTVGEVAYVAAPHLLAIAASAAPHLRAMLLVTIGTIEASRRCYPRGAAALRAEWKVEYERACAGARALIADTLREPGDAPADTQQLIGALAALHGNANVCLLLEGGPDLTCPECGASIEFGDA